MQINALYCDTSLYKKHCSDLYFGGIILNEDVDTDWHDMVKKKKKETK